MQRIFYNPIDPSQVVKDKPLNIAAVVFFSICLLLYAVAFTLMFWQCYKIKLSLRVER